MRGLLKSFLYLKYYFEPEERFLCKRAFWAAKKHFKNRPVRSSQRPYPRLLDYEQRRMEFLAFQRGYKNTYRHEYAKAKLRETTIR